jgi:hypothetical protein
MKKHIDEILMIVYAVFVSVIIFMLSSCSPQYHLNKFHKKGGKIECKGDTTYIEKVIKGKDGKDSIIYVPTKEYIPQIEYRTKWQVRFDNKRFNDSLKYIRLMYKDSVRTVVKTEKIKGKTEVKIQRVKSRWYLWLIIGFVLAHLLRYAWTIIGAFRNFPNNRL